MINLFTKDTVSMINTKYLRSVLPSNFTSHCKDLIIRQLPITRVNFMPGKSLQDCDDHSYFGYSCADHIFSDQNDAVVDHQCEFRCEKLVKCLLRMKDAQRGNMKRKREQNSGLDFFLQGHFITIFIITSFPPFFLDETGLPCR